KRQPTSKSRVSTRSSGRGRTERDGQLERDMGDASAAGCRASTAGGPHAVPALALLHGDEERLLHELGRLSLASSDEAPVPESEARRDSPAPGGVRARRARGRRGASSAAAARTAGRARARGGAVLRERPARPVRV